MKTVKTPAAKAGKTATVSESTRAKEAQATAKWLESAPAPTQITDEDHPTDSATFTARFDLELSAITWMGIRASAHLRGWSIKEMIEEMCEEGAINYEFHKNKSKRRSEEMDAAREGAK